MGIKTWAEKLHNGKGAKTVVLDKPYAGIPAGAKMYVATPEIIDRYIRSIPRSETRTVQDLRKDLARAAKADATCPTSTGIFIRIAAEAAIEEMAAGKNTSQVAPFWRVIEPGSPVAKRLSCGDDFIETMLASEYNTNVMAGHDPAIQDAASLNIPVVTLDGRLKSLPPARTGGGHDDREVV